MSEIPKQKQIKKTCCTYDGKNKIKENLINCPDHYFIVLTKEDYNTRSDSFLGVPMGSLKNETPDYFQLNFGIDINNDDIRDTMGGDLLSKQTFVLCDKISRVDKSDIIIKVDDTRITNDKYKEIVENIQSFVEFGKKLSN